MSGPLDRTAVADRLDMIGATADFLAATEARELARRKILRLARRIVANPTLTDEEIVPAAYKIALDARSRLAGEAVSDV